MNILQINKYITINGGSETVMKNVYEVFRANHHVVKNLGFHKKNQPYMEDTIDLGEEKQKIGTFFTDRVLVDKIIDTILDMNIDMVFCHNVYHHFPIYSLFKSIKSKTKAKLVLFLHDYKVVCPTYTLLREHQSCVKCSNKAFLSCTLNRCKDNSFIKSAILTLESYYNNKFHDAYSFVDTIIAPSHFLSEKVKTMGFQHEVFVLHNPLTNFSAPMLKQKVQNSLLYVGRLSEEKGILLLLQIAASLPDIHFDIIGDGPLRNAIQEAAVKYKNITWHGYQGKEFIQQKMSSSKYLLIPSICFENNPMVVLEAMSIGLPVIGSNKGGIPELIEASRGKCFDPNNLSDTVAQIQNMLSITDTKYKDMQEACISFTRYNSVSNYYSTLANILQLRTIGTQNEQKNNTN